MVERIPLLDASPLYAFQDEIEAVRDEFPFHYSTGVEHWDLEMLNQCPRFKAWLLSEGIFTEEDFNLKNYSDFRQADGSIDYAAHQRDPRATRISFAVQGT